MALRHKTPAVYHVCCVSCFVRSIPAISWIEWLIRNTSHRGVCFFFDSRTYRTYELVPTGCSRAPWLAQVMPASSPVATPGTGTNVRSGEMHNTAAVVKCVRHANWQQGQMQFHSIFFAASSRFTVGRFHGLYPRIWTEPGMRIPNPTDGSSHIWPRYDAKVRPIEPRKSREKKNAGFDGCGKK